MIGRPITIEEVETRGLATDRAIRSARLVKSMMESDQWRDFSHQLVMAPLDDVEHVAFESTEESGEDHHVRCIFIDSEGRALLLMWCGLCHVFSPPEIQ